jgi:hypothetical protein
MGEGVLNPPVPGTYYNGLLGVSIIPYKATTTDAPDAIEQVPAPTACLPHPLPPSTTCKASALAPRNAV